MMMFVDVYDDVCWRLWRCLLVIVVDDEYDIDYNDGDIYIYIYIYIYIKYW